MTKLAVSALLLLIVATACADRGTTATVDAGRTAADVHCAGEFRRCECSPTTPDQVAVCTADSVKRAGTTAYCCWTADACSCAEVGCYLDAAAHACMCGAGAYAAAGAQAVTTCAPSAGEHCCLHEGPDARCDCSPYACASGVREVASCAAADVMICKRGTELTNFCH